MRTAKDGNGERLFSYEDFLTSQQISSFFSRLAARRSVEVDQSDSEDETPGEDFQSVLSDMTPTTSVSWCQTPSLVHFLYHCLSSWIAKDTNRSNPGGRILLRNQHGEELTAKHVIIAVPLTVLKDGDINFIPALPANKNTAIDKIQMLGAWKIVCRFKHRFWPEKLHQIYSVRGFVSEIWTCTRDSPDSDDKCHVIVGFETAEPAQEKSVLSGQELLQGFLSYLNEIFGYENRLCF